MINDFFKTVQNDATLIMGAFNKPGLKDAEKTKVNHAAFRSFAALGMTYACIKGLKILTMSSGPGLVIGLGLTALQYALYHDGFIYCRNLDKDTGSHATAAARGICEDIKDLWTQNKNKLSAPRHPHNEGTFFRPIWDKIEWEILKSKYKKAF